uniref:Uncharacterized protein n=1 Tax=Klebsiella phage FKP3 TaxID=3231233 RepID=A0AAU8I046_9CAUD|nr:MAG TPA: hypothetical protein [Caudoviricetes sp.]
MGALLPPPRYLTPLSERLGDFLFLKSLLFILIL